MATLKKEKPRGILNPTKGEENFTLQRFIPAEDIAFFVEHFWIVEWDLRGLEPYTSETLPHPSIHIVFEKDRSYVIGILNEKFGRILRDNGIVFGIKFKPGAFYPFVKAPVSSFANKLFDLEKIFGNKSSYISTTILNLKNYNEMTELAENFLREILPERDENILLINKMVEQIIADRSMVKVDDLVDRFDINKRVLQRLFNIYVGVSPKWMIKRYRLHDVADQLATTQEKNWAKFAVDLGYYDQAHFIKDFKSIVGKSPEEYAKQNLPG